MKVLYITNVPSPYRVDFFNELSQYCELTIVYERKKSADRDKNWETPAGQGYSKIFLKGINITSDGAICPGIIRILNRQWDIIVVGGYATPTGMMAVSYLKLLRKAFLLNADGGFIQDDKSLKYKIKRGLIGSASAWLSTGEMTTKYLMHYGAVRKYVYEYPFSSIRAKSISASNIDRSKKKKQLNIKEKTCVISVGQFIKRKGFEELLSACATLEEEIGVYIIGGTPPEEYKVIVNKLKLKNVTFLGFKTKEELLEYYMAADIFVLPTREDIWGLVINEAMACELPIITTDKCIAGRTMIKEGISGFIVPIMESKILSEKINFLAREEAIREQMGHEALKTAQNYTIESMAEAHYRIFCNILNSGS